MTPRTCAGFILLTILIAAGAGGCTILGGQDAPDPVSGNWTGAWYRAGQKEPAGRLSFRMTADGPGSWRAVVEAASEVEATYEFTLRGRVQGSRVLFEDETDLGRAGGGIYVWSGEIAGDIFQGVFRNPAGDGRFELVRRPEPASVLPVE